MSATATYLVETLILCVPSAWRKMVPSIPLVVLQIAIVDVVLHDLLLRHSLTRTILKVAIGKAEHLLSFPAPKRSIAFFCSYWWPHVLENHDILPRHDGAGEFF